MRILVTGGAGYLGSVLTRRLLQAGHEVRVLDKLLFGRRALNGLESSDRFDLVVGDVSNLQDVTRAMTDVDAVADLAAIVGDPACQINNQLTIKTNYWATRLLAEVAQANEVDRLVFASTCSVYGVSNGDTSSEDSNPNPLSLYAKTKVNSERALLETKNGTKPVILRLSTLCGPSYRMRFDLVLNIMTATAHFENRVKVFGGSQYRPLLDVRDAAKAFHMFLEAPRDSIHDSIFNVGVESQNLTIGELGELVAEATGNTPLEVFPESEDKRSYKVDFERIGSFGYVAEHSLSDSVRDIMAKFRAGEILDYKDDKYYNVRYDYLNDTE